jgi:hypothetical protein
MTLEDNFGELDGMLASHSMDHEAMRAKLKAICDKHGFVRMMGPAQDRLYASIARGHRKALVHLEAGNTAAAMQEAAKAVAWFYTRFQGDDLESMTRFPQIAEELRAVRELVSRSEILREAVKNTKGNEIHDP